jgi:diaminopimelate decarboxylase
VLSVNSVEMKQNTRFAGVNAGFNIALEPAVYNMPFQPVLAQLRDGAPERVTIVGNINEALDVFYHNIELPPLKTDDMLVLINAGAYSSSMASNHCMRGDFKEFLLMSR